MPRTYSKDLVYEELTQAVATQLKNDVDRLVGGLFGSGKNAIPGASSVPENEVVTLLQRNWDHQNFRERMLQNVGPEKFLDLAEKAGFYQADKDGPINGSSPEPSAESSTEPSARGQTASLSPEPQTDLNDADSEGLN